MKRNFYAYPLGCNFKEWEWENINFSMIEPWLEGNMNRAIRPSDHSRELEHISAMWQVHRVTWLAQLRHRSKSDPATSS